MRNGNPRLEPGDSLETETRQVCLVTIKAERRNHIEIRIHQTEPLRHHADDFPRLPIDRNAAPDHRPVSAEAALPISVAKHDGFRTMRILVGRQQPTAKDRRLAERLQHAVSNQSSVHFMRLVDAGDIGRARAPHAQRLKRPVLLGEGEIHGGREAETSGEVRQPRGPRSDQMDGYQLLCVRIGQRLEQHAVEHAEDRRVGADSDCQGQDDRGGKPRRFSQSPEYQSQVRPERFHQRKLPHFAAALFQHRGVSESAAGSLFCLDPAHAFGHELLRPLLEMKAHFVAEIAIELIATEDTR